MGAQELKNALQGASEVELTTTGGKSGNESSRPIWFVKESDKLLLLPVSGSESNWYRNVAKTPAIGLAANGAELRAEASRPRTAPPSTTSSRPSAPSTAPTGSRSTTPASTPQSRSRSPDGGALTSARAPIAQLDTATPS